MAKKHFYAIKNGRVPGIYASWDEAKVQVERFPGADYKGFATEAEARAYMGEDVAQGTEGNDEVVCDVDLPADGNYAFVDGSYNLATKTYGYGGFLMHDGVEHVLMGAGDDAENAEMRNVAGEIHGAMAAVQKAIELGIDRITLFYDYRGIAEWALDRWKANKPKTREYRDFMHAAMTCIHISFVHTPGHTGIPGNERADGLAKEAVGLKR